MENHPKESVPAGLAFQQRGFVRRAKGQRYTPNELPTASVGQLLERGYKVESLGYCTRVHPMYMVYCRAEALAVTTPDGKVLPATRLRLDGDENYVVTQDLDWRPL